MIQPKSDEYFMREALKEAQKAFDLDEVPIGAVIVSNNRIIARAHNLTERLNDVTAHAEMQAFTSAAEFLGGKYLHNCSLYVTVEPCIMCIGAICEARIEKVFFGAYATNKENFSNKIKFYKRNNYIDHLPKFTGGILEKECSSIIKNFFKRKRG